MMTDSAVFIRPSPIENISDTVMMESYELLEQSSLVQSLEPSCILIMIITGKIIMNAFIFGARKKNWSSSFMGYFCMSLAFADLAFLISISSLHYFQDFAVWGFRFTTYHICLLMQIMSHTYGILHCPVFIVCGLDYYLTIVRSVNLPRLCTRCLYAVVVLLLWTMAFIYTLHSPASMTTSDTGLISYKCTFYISSHSFYLSAVIVIAIFMVLATCPFELVGFIKSTKITSYADKTVILFSYIEWPIRGTKYLLITLLLSFLGTWMPFIILLMVILLSGAHIPGYMDMNVPWLYFMNSLLIGICYFIKYPTLQLTERTLSMDPFINWKYCVLPFDVEHGRKLVSKEMASEIVI